MKSTEQRNGLQAPRYGLRGLLFSVAGIAVVITLMTWIGPLASLALALGILAILLHVAGNAMGTQLRSLGDRQARDERPEEASPVMGKPRRRPTDREFAPATRLCEYSVAGWSLLAAGLIGTVVGGAVGLRFFSGLAVHRPSTSGVVLGTLAGAVLGGLFFFWAFGFFKVVVVAWWQAHRYGRGS